MRHLGDDHHLNKPVGLLCGMTPVNTTDIFLMGDLLGSDHDSPCWLVGSEVSGGLVTISSLNRIRRFGHGFMRLLTVLALLGGMASGGSREVKELKSCGKTALCGLPMVVVQEPPEPFPAAYPAVG